MDRWCKVFLFFAVLGLTMYFVTQMMDAEAARDPASMSEADPQMVAQVRYVSIFFIFIGAGLLTLKMLGEAGMDMRKPKDAMEAMFGKRRRR